MKQMLFQKYDTILFDADGTLMDFSDAEHQALLRTFRAHDLPFDEQMDARYQQINNALWRQFEQSLITKETLLHTRFAKLFEELSVTGIDADAFNTEYLFNLGYGSKTLPYAVEVCRQLHARGCRLYILTNGVAATQRRRIHASGLMPFLSDIFVSEEAGCPKPALAYFEYVFARIPAFIPEHALMVGDSLSSDMQGAYRAGIDRCWLCSDSAKQAPIPIQYSISSLKELLDQHN